MSTQSTVLMLALGHQAVIAYARDGIRREFVVKIGANSFSGERVEVERIAQVDHEAWMYRLILSIEEVALLAKEKVYRATLDGEPVDPDNPETPVIVAWGGDPISGPPPAKPEDATT